MVRWPGNHEGDGTGVPDTWREIIARQNRRRRTVRRLATLTLALLVVVTGLTFWISQMMVAPPRPRPSAEKVPVVGLELRQLENGELEVVHAAAQARFAGLQPGDRLVTVDGKTLREPQDLDAALSTAADGELLRVEARRPEAPGLFGAVLVDLQVEHRSLSPGALELPFEEVAFNNPAGLLLRGWFVPAPTTARRAPAVIYGHGHRADRRQWLPYVWTVHRAGFAQLLFDFSGRGESEGQLVTLGAAEAVDLRAALGFLAGRAEIDRRRVVIVGRDTGAVAAILAAQHGAAVRALVLDSPYADLSRVVDHRLRRVFLPSWPLRPWAFRLAAWRADFDPDALTLVPTARQLDLPLLILHGVNDVEVPIEHAERLAAAAGARATLMPLVGLGHRDRRPRDTREAVAAFLRQSIR